MAPRFITIPEAAESLGLAASTLRKQIAKGKLVAMKVGPRTWYVTTGEVERYRADHKRNEV
jgi:excisionase family DNA binding protein